MKINIFFLIEKSYDFQKEVGRWAKQTFPQANKESIIARLKKEVAELEESETQKKEAKEIANCVLLLMHRAYQLNINMMQEVIIKHKTNQKRKWGKPDKNGVVEHIKPERRKNND